MTAQVPQPLPECLGCEQPTRRDVYTANGGLCTACRADVDHGLFLQLRPVAFGNQS